MKLQSSDPDVETIVKRIKNNQIDLQPDFQRGSVWNIKKKQLLVDSILRSWHIPPVHIVTQAGEMADEVLDDQQRLAAISEFCNDEFSVDGNLEPHDEFIASLDGLKFSELPITATKIINNFSISVMYVTDFSPKEPGELFFRLNHQVTLTPAEARNAYFGKVRDQVKKIANQFDEWGLTKANIGFSNARMAHDDVVARIMCVLEHGSLKEKVTANKLADRYRSETPFPEEAVNLTEESFKVLGQAIRCCESHVNLNKATLWSWVMFLAYYIKNTKNIDVNLVGKFLDWFESQRLYCKGFGMDTNDANRSMMVLFNDRAASRVSDVSSVVIRDMVLWASFKNYTSQDDFEDLKEHANKANDLLSLSWENYGSSLADKDVENFSLYSDIEESWGDDL